MVILIKHINPTKKARSSEDFVALRPSHLRAIMKALRGRGKDYFCPTLRK
jgi:hypothetical protein